MGRREVDPDGLSFVDKILSIIASLLVIAAYVSPDRVPSPDWPSLIASAPSATPGQLHSFSRFLLVSFAVAGAVGGGRTQGKAFRELTLRHILFSFLFAESARGALGGALAAFAVLMIAPHQLVGYLFTFNWQVVLVLGLVMGVLFVTRVSPAVVWKAVGLVVLGGVLAMVAGLAVAVIH